MNEDDVVYAPGTPNYVEPQWFRDHAGRIFYWKGGPIKPGENFDMDKCITLDYRMVNQLIPYLKDQGLLAGLLENTSREEDIKIIHRLVDLLEGKK